MIGALREMNDLSGHVALVTGAGRGIGKAIALEFARCGASVAVTARTSAQIEDTAVEIERLGVSSLAIPGDVSDPNSVDMVAEAVAEKLGRVDVLVNNAGSLLFKPLIPLPGLRPDHLPEFSVPTSDEEWRSQIDVHLSGAFYYMRAVGQAMLENGHGRVINIGSVAVTRSARFNTAYEAAKGGLAALTRSVAKEWARHGVTVNCIAAGHFHTEMSSDLHTTEQGREWIVSRVPMRRVGNLEEIAALATFLAGPASSFITGQVIHIDGGETL